MMPDTRTLASLHRLSPHLWALPTLYRFHLEPRIDESLIEGRATIAFRTIATPDPQFTAYLNCQRGVKVLEATIENESVIFGQIPENLRDEFEVWQYRIPSAKRDSVRSVGTEFELELRFETAIRSDLEGVYWAKWKGGGESLRMITTKFEPHFARRAFPCIDEPSVKARFQFQFLLDPDLEVLHNTSVKSVEKDEESGKVLHTFQETIQLSTYLLAFCIGKFDIFQSTIKNTDNSDILVQCIGPKGTGGPIEPTLEHNINVLRELMLYFGHFPITKIANVAIPDFSSGAMENMGLITYRDSILHFTPESGLRQRLFCILVMCHELAHTWFGNLVTMKWWNDLWLNESFAMITEVVVSQSCYEKLGLGHTYNFMQMYLSEDKVEGMKLDAQKSTHAISVPVHKPTDIQSLFDAISYNKGSSIIYMCMGYMGTDKFYESVRVYLEEFKFGNAEANNLWNTMSRHSKLDITSLMSYWIQNSGFPCVQFELDADGRSLNLHQHQYTSVNCANSDPPKIWPIPLHLEIRCANSHQIHTLKTLFDTPQATLRLPVPHDQIDAIKLNKDAHTFMVYTLDTRLSQILASSFTTFLNEFEQIDYINNLAFLMRSTRQSTDSQPPQLMYPKYTMQFVLESFDHFKIGVENHVAIDSMLSLVSEMLGFAKKCDVIQAGYLERFNTIVAHILSKYPIPDTSFLQSQSYAYVNANLKLFALHIHLKSQSTIEECLRIYDARNQVPIHDSLITFVYQVAASRLFDSSNNDIDPEVALNQWLLEINAFDQSNVRAKAIVGLAKAIPTNLLYQFLDFALSEQSKMQDILYYIVSLDTPHKISALLQYFVDKRHFVCQKTTFRIRLRLVKALSQCFETKDIEKLRQLQNEEDFCNARVIDETIDFIKANQNLVNLLTDKES